MDEYSVLCDGAIRALLDGGPGASDLPSDALTAPCAPIAHGSSPRRAWAGPDAWTMGEAERSRGLRRLAAFDPWAAEAVDRELSRASWASDVEAGR